MNNLLAKLHKIHELPKFSVKNFLQAVSEVNPLRAFATDSGVGFRGLSQIRIPVATILKENSEKSCNEPKSVVSLHRQSDKTTI